MTAPNMASITALEKSLQNCSLNRSSVASGGGGGGGGGDRSRASDTPKDLSHSDTSLELNSNISLPYQWEQCLDLETGEVYYINWEDGTKEKEDPRRKMTRFNEQNYYSDEEEEEEEEQDENSYDSEGSSSILSPSPSRDDEEDEEEDYNEEGDHILVVAGCKSCMMYFMLPKRVGECPKCNGLILHFDRLENGSL